MAKMRVQEVDGGVVFTVKVIPGSSRMMVCGLLGGMVKIKVSAPPEKGKANCQLIEFLAKQLGVKKNSVGIISGRTNPVKNVKVLGVSAEELLKQLDLNK